MKPYIIPLTKSVKTELKSPFLQSSIGIHHEIGYPEDAVNSSFFDH